MTTMEMPHSNVRKGKLQSVVLNKYFWMVFCSFFFVYPLYKSMNRVLPPELPVLYKVPEFTFQDENGKDFGSKDLKGRYYIAGFHFTSCPTICPKLMSDFQKIQKRVRGLGQKVAIVAFTVDPEVDTSKVLFKKAREYGANPYVWKFLRSDVKATEELLVKGFKVPMGDKADIGTTPGVYDIVHSGKLILVDADGNIRGYYGTEKVEVDKLMLDVGLLVNRKKLKFKKKES